MLLINDLWHGDIRFNEWRMLSDTGFDRGGSAGFPDGHGSIYSVDRMAPCEEFRSLDLAIVGFGSVHACVWLRNCHAAV